MSQKYFSQNSLREQQRRHSSPTGPYTAVIIGQNGGDGKMTATTGRHRRHQTTPPDGGLQPAHRSVQPHTGNGKPLWIMPSKPQYQ